jgi:hypothetical protein
VNLGSVVKAMRNDLRMGLADQQMVYVLIAPLILAAAYLLLMPVIEGAKPTVVAAGSFRRAVVEQLEKRCHVIWLKDREAVMHRVEGIDDLIGVYGQSGLDPEVIYEGNEPAALRQYPGYVINEVVARIEGGKQLKVRWLRVEPDSKRSRSSDLALLLLMASLIVTLFPALALVEDRESGALQSLRVSPLSFGEYVAAKFILIMALALVSSLGTALIVMGSSAPFASLAAAGVSVLPTALLTLLLLGALADNQLAAMTVMKVGMPLLLAPAVAGFFISPEAQVWLKPLTPYWSAQALRAALDGDVGALGNALVWSLLSGLPVVAVALVFLRKCLRWR